MIDAHQHVWALSNAFHGWPDATLGVIHRDFGPGDWREAAHAAGVSRSILVQAQEDWRETLWLLALAERHPEIAGVVGWVDLADAEAPERIALLARHPRCKGLRPMLQDMADPGWLLSPGLRPAFHAMIRHGMRLDALVRPVHLPMLHRFRHAWPDLPLVIDHAGKPSPDGAGYDDWQESMVRLSDLGVACKFSGLLTELTPDEEEALLEPFVRTLLSLFPDRLLWGSDWPVCLLADRSYAETLAFARDAVAAHAPERAGSIFAGAAAAFYGLDGRGLS